MAVNGKKKKGCNRILALVMTLGLLLCLATSAYAEAVPEIDGAAYVLMETSTGQVLAEKNSDVKRFPASTTKIMTLVLALEAVDRGDVSLEDEVTTSEYAASMGGSQVYLFPGEKRTLHEMLIGIAVGSGNDASVAVAEFIGGSEEGFVEMMNKRAQELGMTGTHYANPHGLHNENHYTTAADMAKLGLHALQVPKLLDYTSIYEYDFRTDPKPLKLWNTNRLLKWYDGADGLKTGYTSEAKRNLVATAKRDDLRFLTVVMGVEPRNGHFTESMKLLNYGFNTYQFKLLHPKDEIVCGIPVQKGVVDKVDAKVANDVGALTQKNAKEEYTTNIKVDQFLNAPVEEGVKLGVMEVLKDGQVMQTVDLLAAKSVPKISAKQAWEDIVKDILIFN